MQSLQKQRVGLNADLSNDISVSVYLIGCMMVQQRALRGSELQRLRFGPNVDLTGLSVGMSVE